MYLEHFKLKAAPFAITPDPRFFYEGAKYKKLLTVLQDRLAQGCLCTFTGVKGVGKSTVIMQLCRSLGRRYKIIRLTRPDMTPENLLNYLVFELKLADSLLEGAAAEMQLQNWLAKAEATHRLIVIVENADKMPLSSRQVLSKLSTAPLAEGNLFSVLFSGSIALQGSLENSDGVELAASYTLPRMNRKEVREYLDFRVTHVGCFPGNSLFDKAVSNRIAKLSNGIPRNIHLLADKVLCAAFNLKAPVPIADMLVETPSLEEIIIDDVPAEQHRYEWLLALGCVGLALLIYWVEPGQHQSNELEIEPVAQQSPVTDVSTPVLELVNEGLALEETLAQDIEVTATTVEFETVVESIELSAESSNADSSVEAVEIVVAEPIQQVAPAPSILAVSQQRLLAWLNEQPSTAGTIQLLLVRGGEDSRINEYLEQLSDSLDANQLMTYSTVRQGRAYYGVLYQQYASRAVAAGSLSGLPAEVQKLGPFIVRSAKGVEDEQGQI